MKNNLVSEGMTYSMVIPAVFTVATGGVMCVFFSIPGCILLLLGVYFFTVTSGFELDAQRKRYRSYKQLFGVNWGVWHQLKNVHRAETWLSSETQSMMRLNPLGSANYYSSKSTLKSITYDLILVSDEQEIKPVFEFLSYKKALEALRMIQDELQLPVRDRIAEKLAKNQIRRQRR